MSIQVNSGASQVNWESLLSKLGDVEKSTSADGKESFKITMKSGEDTKTFSVNIPDDLELPESVDSKSIDSLISKLTDITDTFTPEEMATLRENLIVGYNMAMESLSKSGGTSDTEKTEGTTATEGAEAPNSKSTKSVMFDIYALMQLLIEVAQKQKDASRELRSAESLSIQNAIQNQANQQAAAAWIGLVVGVTTAAISFTASAIMTGMQINQGMKQADMTKSAGLDASQTKVDMLVKADSVPNSQKQLAATMKDVGVDTAAKVSADYNAKLNDPESGNLRMNFNQAKTNFDQKTTNYSNAKSQLNEAKITLDTKEQAKTTAQTNLDAKKAEVGLDAKQTEYDNAVKALEDNEANFGKNSMERPQLEARVNETKAALDTAKAQIQPQQQALEQATQEVNTAQNDVNLKQNDVNIAKGEVDTAKGQYDTARNDLAKRAGSIADEYTNKYDAALKRQANPPAGADKAQLKADVETARNEMKMARALQANDLAQEGVLSPGEHSDLVTSARVEADAASNRFVSSTDYKSVERRIIMLTGLNQVFTQFGNIGQSVSQGVSQLMMAEATRTNAEQEKSKEELDQTKDLYSAAQDLVNKVVQIMQAVSQAESQSVRDAIQA